MDYTLGRTFSWCSLALSTQELAFFGTQPFEDWKRGTAVSIKAELTKPIVVVAEDDVPSICKQARFSITPAIIVAIEPTSNNSWRISRTLFDLGFICCAYSDEPDKKYRLYLRSELFTRPNEARAPSRGKLSMASLGQNGRFANQLHQYAFLRLYSLRHELSVQTPEWRGYNLFDLPVREPIDRQWPTLAFEAFKDDDLALWDLDDCLINLDVSGFFQEIPACWLPHASFLSKTFVLQPSIAEPINRWVSMLTVNGTRKLAACHVRRGDYETVGSDLTPWFRPISLCLYKQWIEFLRSRGPDYVVYVATDDPLTILPELSTYNIVSSALAPNDIVSASDIVDFAILQRADELAIANSSYSRMAALTSTVGGNFYLPNLVTSSFEPYLPWNDRAFWDRFGTKMTDARGFSSTLSSMRRRSLFLRVDNANLRIQLAKANSLAKRETEAPRPLPIMKRNQISYPEVFSRYACPTKGVIHIGGFLGTEDHTYRAMGFASRLFIEAQASTFQKLKANLENSGAFLENVAVSDHNGKVLFHEANNGQSSSILALKRHSSIYPDIKEVATYEVESKRVDDIMSQPKFLGKEFNFLNIDIQGAELLALSGAVLTLKRVDIINVEVNFDELYEGAPNISQLDSFLSAFGFQRADTFLWHATWGDAIYVRRELMVA